MKKYIKLVVILLISIFLFSCEKNYADISYSSGYGIYKYNNSKFTGNLVRKNNDGSIETFSVKKGFLNGKYTKFKGETLIAEGFFNDSQLEDYKLYKNEKLKFHRVRDGDFFNDNIYNSDGNIISSVSTFIDFYTYLEGVSEWVLSPEEYFSFPYIITSNDLNEKYKGNLLYGVHGDYYIGNEGKVNFDYWLNIQINAAGRMYNMIEIKEKNEEGNILFNYKKHIFLQKENNEKDSKFKTRWIMYDKDETPDYWEEYKSYYSNGNSKINYYKRNGHSYYFKNSSSDKLIEASYYLNEDNIYVKSKYNIGGNGLHMISKGLEDNYLSLPIEIRYFDKNENFISSEKITYNNYKNNKDNFKFIDFQYDPFKLLENIGKEIVE
ncbi:hypothetical protein [uncultured Ilyobacter sp.]|uniref:hypothetical protein n=1 Tax=uncultured Ilyobacter sp. TaxID=544433 RepID=UPI0029BFAA5A|nr:hypothetical protein [uncultured Ilyobacter sp.]